ncbi:hypothetical protein HOV23_gp078 [Pseudomonas phage Lana]|uniref:Uncharacterized protein n=1 Tax=Pseudomonas phage Lana TaxID=2530172 RepID=A0A481W696_9CAUD|nr:hypothetical protein HOV23_gp078 [Pseudomonas phage Lana]QBJ04495.1 hypothetical protein [Pseudomonas phage Lana]
MSVQASCNLFNSVQAAARIHLKVGGYAAFTYGGNMRIGTSGEDPMIEIGRPPETVLITTECMGHKLSLGLTHGRDDPAQDMDDFGFDADSIEGHVVPKGDAILFVEGVGAKVINYKPDNTWDELLVPYVGDMLFYGGKYYGDYSADNDGGVDSAKEESNSVSQAAGSAAPAAGASPAADGTAGLTPAD